MSQNLSSAAVVIGALRAKIDHALTCIFITMCFYNEIVKMCTIFWKHNVLLNYLLRYTCSVIEQ